MLEKLLRARLPEQIVALLEKLEQNPDTSHLEKVARLMDHHESNFTKYEEWMLRRTMIRIRNVIRRAQTLNRAMSIVINEPSEEELRRKEYVNYMTTAIGQSTGTFSGTLPQHAAAQQVQIAHINAHQQLMNRVYIPPSTVGHIR
jgi:hypothetical protein